MKAALLILNLSFLLLVSQAAHAQEQIPVHYLYDAQSGERYLGLSAGASAVDEGVAFNVFKNQEAGMIGLYSCTHMQTHQHFTATEVTCKGQITDGLLGYQIQ
jgi:hypothetical protein